MRLIMQDEKLTTLQKNLKNVHQNFKTFGRKNVENIQQIKIV